MRPLSALLLWMAVLIAVLCTLASLVSLFYIAYGYSAVTADMRGGAVFHLSPIGPFIVALAPLCWLLVFWKDRAALEQRDGRISTWIVAVCLIVFLAALAWLHQHITIT